MKKELYLDIWEWDEEGCSFEEVYREMIDHNRWTVDYLIVLKHNETGELWGTIWARPATEIQEGAGDDYDWNLNKDGKVIFRPVKETTKISYEFEE